MEVIEESPTSDNVVINGVQYKAKDVTNLKLTETIVHLQNPESNIYTGRTFDGIRLSGQKYSVIYADPPWSYKVWRKNTKNAKGGRIRIAEAFYEIMTLQDLRVLPVHSLCNEDTLLFMWTTSPCIPDALTLIKAWGFEYKTIAFIWVKKQGEIGLENKLGLGHYTRPNGECILLATRGNNPTSLIVDHSVQQVHNFAIQDHSRKPDEFAYLIDKLVGYDKRKIELFARDSYLHLRDNWDYWGLEA